MIGKVHMVEFHVVSENLVAYFTIIATSVDEEGMDNAVSTMAILKILAIGICCNLGDNYSILQGHVEPRVV